MKFLTKYWWVAIIIIVIIALVAYFMGGKKEAPAPIVSPGFFQGPFMPSEAGTCDKYFKTKAELEAKIKLIENQIGPILPPLPAQPTDWAIKIFEGTKQSWSECGGKTFEECRRLNAIYVLAQQGWCIPQDYV